MRKRRKRVYGIWYREIRKYALSYTLYLIPYALYLYTPTPLLAQQFKIGFLGGISTSQVDGDGHAGYGKVGFFAGGFVTKKFSPESKWSASFEITYIQKGSRKNLPPDQGGYIIYSLKLNYAEVPLLVKYDFFVADSLGKQKMNFSLEGGVAIGALVHSEEYRDYAQVLPGTPGYIPFQKTDYSVLFGINYFLAKHIGFNVRTEYSMIPVRKVGTGTYHQNWTYKFFKPGYYNNLILFSFRYQF